TSFRCEAFVPVVGFERRAPAELGSVFALVFLVRDPTAVVRGPVVLERVLAAAVAVGSPQQRLPAPLAGGVAKIVVVYAGEIVVEPSRGMRGSRQREHAKDPQREPNHRDSPPMTP